MENPRSFYGEAGDKRRMFNMLFILLAVGFGGIMYGFDVGNIAGALLFMGKALDLSTLQLEISASAVAYGGTLALVCSGWLSDMFGRKKMLISSMIFFIIGVILTVVCTDFSVLLIGRLVQGLGIGIITMVVPLYLSEAAPAKIRGKAVVMFQAALTLGIILAIALDLVLTPTGNWRMMFAVILVPGVIFLVGLIFIPESPQYYILKNMDNKALKAILTMFSRKEARDTFKSMRDVREQRILLKAGKVVKQSIFSKRAYIIPFIIVLVIAIAQQLTGVNVVISYLPTILTDSGMSTLVYAMSITLILTFLNCIFTFIALAFVDKIGRRKLVLFGLGFVVLGLFLCVFSFMFCTGGLLLFLLVAGFFIFQSGFAIGPGCVIWLMVSETLPMPIRAKGMGICLACNSLAVAFLVSISLSLQVAIGWEGFIIILACSSVFYLLWVYFFLPEHKGRTNEEVEVWCEEHYGKNRKKLLRRHAV